MDAGGQPRHAADHVVEQLLLAAQFLGALGVVPDAGVLERGRDVLQACLLAVDVKDTSAVRPAAPSATRRWRTI